MCKVTYIFPITKKKHINLPHSKKVVPLQSKNRASVAELVDALDSKSSGVKPVPVRFRPDVLITDERQ